MSNLLIETVLGNWNKSLYESLMLLEDRIDFLKKNNPNISTEHDTLAQHKDASDIIDHFATHADPTKNKAHSQWIVNQYKKGNIRQEDAGRIHDALSNFDRYKGKLAIKDINKYQSLSDVEDAIKPHVGTAASKKEQDRTTKHEGADLIYSDNGTTVHHLKTKEAACLYGKGTKWCTAANKDNKFDEYNKRGNIYVINTPSGNKYQLHNESGQFMNSKDEPVDIKKESNDDIAALGKAVDNIPGSLNSRLKSKIGTVTANDIDKVLDNPNEKWEVKIDAIRHPNVETQHIDKVLDNPNENSYVKQAALEHHKIEARHIDKILDNPNEDSYVKKAALEHPKSTVHHIDKVLDNPKRDVVVTQAALKHPKLEARHIDKILDNPNGNWLDKEAALYHPKSESRHFDKVLDNPNENERVRIHAIRHPKADVRHIDAVFDNPNESMAVKYSAVNNPNSKLRHLNALLDDPNITSSVRWDVGAIKRRRGW